MSAVASAKAGDAAAGQIHKRQNAKRKRFRALPSKKGISAEGLIWQMDAVFMRFWQVVKEDRLTLFFASKTGKIEKPLVYNPRYFTENTVFMLQMLKIDLRPSLI